MSFPTVSTVPQGPVPSVHVEKAIYVTRALIVRLPEGILAKECKTVPQLWEALPGGLDAL